MSTMDRVRATLERPLASYQLLLGSSILLLGFGLIMVLSASSVFSYATFDNSYYIFFRQLIWAGLGVLCALIAARLPLKVIRALAYPALIVAFGAIAATFVPGVGIEVNGNQNWIGLGPVRAQPSELAKLAVILWAADLFARKEKLLKHPRHILIPMAPVAFTMAMLVVWQQDLGTALILFAIIAGLLWTAGLPGKYMGTALLGLAVVAVYFVATSPNRLQRVASFLDPFADPSGTGYQASNGLMALANGGFFGVGLGAGQQKWGRLPEAHTDFVFAVIGEELGLFGTVVLLGLFLTLAYAGIRIAMRTNDPFIRYAAAGITVWFASQAIINIGMVLALLPVIGVPLPFISYGGSSLMPTVVAVGLLVNFARNEPAARRALKAEKRKGSATTAGRTVSSKRKGRR